MTGPVSLHQTIVQPWKQVLLNKGLSKEDLSELDTKPRRGFDKHILKHIYLKAFTPVEVKCIEKKCENSSFCSQESHIYELASEDSNRAEAQELQLKAKSVCFVHDRDNISVVRYSYREDLKPLMEERNRITADWTDEQIRNYLSGESDEDDSGNDDEVASAGEAEGDTQFLNRADENKSATNSEGENDEMDSSEEGEEVYTSSEEDDEDDTSGVD